MCNKQNCNFIEIVEDKINNHKYFIHYEMKKDKNNMLKMIPIYFQYEDETKEILDFELIKSGRKCW
jgi:hypothetical protein